MKPRPNFYHFYRRIGFLLLGLYWVALFVGTHASRPVMDLSLVHDKMWHFGAFAGLACLLAGCLATIRPTRGVMVWVFLVAAAYGALDELTQLLVPGRRCDFHDWLADVAGVAAGLIAYGTVVALLYVARLGPLRGSSVAAPE